MAEFAGSVSRRSRFLRGVLAGPLVFLCSVAVMGGLAVLIPPGPALINNVAVPLVLFPGAWGLLFFYACLDVKLLRAYAVVAGLMLLNGGLIGWHFIQTAEAAA